MVWVNIIFKLDVRLRMSKASKNRDCSWFFFLHLSSLVSELFLVLMVLMNFFDEIFWWIFLMNFFGRSFWRIFLTKFFDDFFDEFLFTNFFEEFFFGRFLLTYNLLTIASFRIGVPSILFFFILILKRENRLQNNLTYPQSQVRVVIFITSTWGVIVVKSNSFVRFLVEIEDTKNHFEIIWPLVNHKGLVWIQFCTNFWISYKMCVRLFWPFANR